MILDFHLGNNPKVASYQVADSSFELQPHTLLFNRFGLPEGKFPLFKRLEDYYKDANFSSMELQSLVKETTEIKELHIEDIHISKQLDIIIKTCNLALKENTNIWVFCD